MSDKQIRVLIVDDHPTMAYGTKLIVEQIESVQVIGITGTGAEGLAFVKSQQPNLVILDLSLPDMHGIEVAYEMKHLCEELHLVIYSGEEHVENYLNQLLDIGVSGWMHKRVSPAQVRRMIRCVLDGETVLPLNLFRQMRLQSTSSATLGMLNDRDKQLLRYLVDGKSNLDIAELMFVSVKTVETHLTHLYRKLDVSSRHEAVLRYGAIVQSKRSAES